MENTENKPSNPRMHNSDGMYASEARAEDYVSLRDHFAGLAMSGHLASKYGAGVYCTKQNMDYLARGFYEMADSMLKAREL